MTAQPTQQPAQAAQQLSTLISSRLSQSDLPKLHTLVSESDLSAQVFLESSIQAVDYLNAFMTRHEQHTEKEAFVGLKLKVGAVNQLVRALQQKDEDEEWDVKDKGRCQEVVMRAALLRLEADGMVRDILKEIVAEARRKMADKKG